MDLGAKLEDVIGLRPFTAREAHVAGFATRDLARLTASGELVQPFRGAYRDPRGPDDLASRAAALGLVLPPGAAAARGTAAWLWGIDVRPPGEQGRIPSVEAVVPAGRVPMRRPGLRCYAAPSADGDVVEVGGVPCTSPERTALDLVRWLPEFMGLAALDAMANAVLVSPASLMSRALELPGARGIAKARRLIDLCEPRTESFGESWTRLRIVDAGYPRPEVQIRILDGDREVYRLDLGYSVHRRAFEYDGEEFHSSPEARAADEARRRRLEREFDWVSTPVTKGDVLGRSMRLERAVGEIFGVEPRFAARRW